MLAGRMLTSQTTFLTYLLFSVSHLKCGIRTEKVTLECVHVAPKAVRLIILKIYAFTRL